MKLYIGVQVSLTHERITMYCTSVSSSPTHFACTSSSRQSDLILTAAVMMLWLAGKTHTCSKQNHSVPECDGQLSHHVIL